MPGPKGSIESRKVVQARKEKHARKVMGLNVKGSCLKSRKGNVIDESVFPVKVKTVKFIPYGRILALAVMKIEQYIKESFIGNPQVLFLHELVYQAASENLTADITQSERKSVVDSIIRQICGPSRNKNIILELDDQLSGLYQSLIEDHVMGKTQHLVNVSIGRDDDICQCYIHEHGEVLVRVTPIMVYSAPPFKPCNKVIEEELVNDKYNENDPIDF